MINLMICDDQDVVCQGLNTILSMEKDLKVIGVAGDGQDLIDQLEKKRPDLILLDLKMPVLNGVQAARIIKEKYPSIRILVLTTYDADEWLFDAIRSGVDGYHVEGLQPGGPADCHPRPDGREDPGRPFGGRQALPAAGAPVAARHDRHRQRTVRARARDPVTGGRRVEQHCHCRKAAPVGRYGAQLCQLDLRQAGRDRPHPGSRAGHQVRHQRQEVNNPQLDSLLDQSSAYAEQSASSMLQK